MGLFGFEGDNAREKVIVLPTMCFALAMVVLDNTVVDVALPTISERLGAGVSGLQWIVDGYVLALASLLLTGGIVGDRYGRRKTHRTHDLHARLVRMWDLGNTGMSSSSTCRSVSSRS